MTTTTALEVETNVETNVGVDLDFNNLPEDYPPVIRQQFDNSLNQLAANTQDALRGQFDDMRARPNSQLAANQQNQQADGQVQAGGQQQSEQGAGQRPIGQANGQRPAGNQRPVGQVGNQRPVPGSRPLAKRPLAKRPLGQQMNRPQGQQAPLGQRPVATQARPQLEPVTTVPPIRYLEWTQFGPCSATCGTGAFKTRTRVCSTGDDIDCQLAMFGQPSESESCDGELPECAEWLEWGLWRRCSASCGGGQTQRRRKCSSGNKDDCEGEFLEIRECNAFECASYTE